MRERAAHGFWGDCLQPINDPTTTGERVPPSSVTGDRSQETSYGRTMTCFMVMVHRDRDPRATVGVASTR